MHYGSILLTFAARSTSRADATENGVLRDANGPDRSGHSGTERRVLARARLRVPIKLSEPEQVAAFPAD